MRANFIAYLGFIGIILMMMPNAKAEDVQYDKKLAIQRQQIAQLKIRVESCMNEGSRTMLMQGSRSRDDITLFTVTRCGMALRTLLMKSGISNDQAVAELIHMADDQLDAVTAEGR